MNGICSLLNTGCEYVWLLIHPFYHTVVIILTDLYNTHLLKLETIDMGPL